MKTNDILRKNLRRIMAERGLSQRDVASLSKGRLTQAGVSGILTGKSQGALPTLDALSRALKIEAWELIKIPKQCEKP